MNANIINKSLMISCINNFFFILIMKNIILINSKIIVSSQKFSYTNIRSIYTAEARYAQTMNTIQNIKKYIPNYFIIFMDNSKISTDMIINISKEVDLFLNPVDDDILNNDTDNNPTKAMGELAQIKYALNYIDQIEFDWNNLFKICGRYVINSTFNYNEYENNQNIFKVHGPLVDYKGKMCYYTSFYKISKKNYNQFKISIEESYQKFKNDLNLYNEPLELIFCNAVNDKKIINTLGITVNAGATQLIEDI